MKKESNASYPYRPLCSNNNYPSIKSETAILTHSICKHKIKKRSSRSSIYYTHRHICALVDKQRYYLPVHITRFYRKHYVQTCLKYWRECHVGVEIQIKWICTWDKQTIDESLKYELRSMVVTTSVSNNDDVLMHRVL